MRHHAQLQAQSGQALILGLVFLAVLSIALIAMYNNGRLIAERLKQTHAVDAAAYSGALIQARALNMQAYINLAQVGHQMAMAHLVTLGSWARWSSTEGIQHGRANPPAYVIGMHFGLAHGQAYIRSTKARAIASIANQHNQLHAQYAEHDLLTKQVLARVSQAIDNTMQTARDRAIQEVLQQNYPGKRVEHNIYSQPSSSLQSGRLNLLGDFAHQGLNDLSALPEFAKQKELVSSDKVSNTHLRWEIHSPSNQELTTLFKPKANFRSLLAEVAGVYRFLDARDHTQRSSLPVSERCPWKRHELRRRGHTILNGQGNWQSMDTQSYHALRSNRWIGCYYREYPMGWGWIPGQSKGVPAGMEYAEDPPDDFSTQDFWRWVQSATNWNIFTGSSNPLANSRAVRDRQRWSGGGLVPYIDIRNADKMASLVFTLDLFQDNVQGHSLKTSSVAQAFFERPTQRRDRRFEKPNLWHPYWQARLTAEPSTVEPFSAHDQQRQSGGQDDGV